MDKMMMAPPVCLNCEHAIGIEPNTPQGVDANLPVGARCAWGPTHVHIVDARVHSRGQRKPLDTPRYTVPAQQETAEDAKTIEGILEGIESIGGTE